MIGPALRAGLLVVVAAGRLAAQSVEIDIFALPTTFEYAAGPRNNERVAARGLGLGAAGKLRWSRWRIEGRAFWSSVAGDYVSREPGVIVDTTSFPFLPAQVSEARFTILQADLRGSYWLSRFVALEAGWGRRTLDPDFAGLAVGLVRIGLRSESATIKDFRMWARAAYLPVAEFSGGGDVGFGGELGVGVGFGGDDARIRVIAEYELQGMERTVRADSGTYEKGYGISTVQIGASVKLR